MSSPFVRNGSAATQNVHQLLPRDVKLEEEELPDYNSQYFYPVRLGDVFESRYQVITKLGFGVGSSVWLCRDLEQQAHVAAQSTNEVVVMRHIRSTDFEHPGERYLRLALKEFTICGPGGEHRCLLYAPQGMTYTELRNSLPNRMLDKALLQQSYQLILIGLDLLHQLDVVHTEHPSARKVLQDRTVYRSHSMPITHGTPVLCDFGGARIGERKHRGDVMPDFYRAPEVILGMEWDCKIDIWSIGVMVWDLFEGSRLFYALKNHILDDEQHLAEMVALMGPPPLSFLQRSEKCRKYWDAEGRWIAATPIPEQSLDAREGRLEGEDHKLLLDFLSKILKWLPEERASAQELISHPFLMQRAEQPQRTSTSAMVNYVPGYIDSTPQLDFKAYWEDEDHLAQGEPEPNVRSQTLVYHYKGKKWWIKVTLMGLISCISNEQKASKRERRKEFQGFVKVINYGSLALLDDTMTEIILREEPEVATAIELYCEATDSASRIAGVVSKLRYQIREDPLRVIYLLCEEFPSLDQINITELTNKVEIADGVF
ncbi:protein kinase [Arthroderma uncinatum]|uniref:protein kinase n=1 Tax=Arthroderma uncinatum TaxID=74035 RepID=UPI00144A6C70|nr:protein kinase [Arthroderma uncinatum]KAF3484178.1 protein kinase [Arthroderma uncinatum]